jgi:hypothetical protein
VIFAAFVNVTLAQGPADSGPSAGARRRPHDRGNSNGAPFETGDRQKFRQNAERWLQMTADEQQLLRRREVIRRERIQREAEAALSDSGLKLDQQRREVFQQRYMQERRNLEQGLHSELEEKRQQRLPSLLDRLKKEFEPQQLPKPSSPTPVSTASPGKTTER